LTAGLLSFWRLPAVENLVDALVRDPGGGGNLSDRGILGGLSDRFVTLILRLG
jgi:hypothetical protein